MVRVDWRSRGSLRLFAALLAATVVAGACSATTDKGKTAAKKQGVSAGSSDASGDTASSDTTLVSGSGSGGATSGKSGAKAKTGSGSGGTSTGGTAGPGGVRVVAATGIDVSKKTISIGIRYVTNSQAAIAQFGATGLSAGDNQKQAQAILDSINAAGGIAGLKATPVFAPYDANNPTGTVTEEQNACATFTQDHHVFAVVSPIFSGQTLEQCALDKKMPLIEENYGYVFPISGLNAYYYNPGYPDSITEMKALVDSMVKQGVLTPSSKIGVYYNDAANRTRTVKQGLIPALAAHHLKLTDEMPSNSSNPQAIPSGIIRFKGENIDRMFVMDVGGLETQFLMAAAEGQNYRPKYVLTTRNNPFFQQGSTQTPQAQLAGAIGMGWVPTADIGNPPAAERNASDSRCLNIMSASGQAPADPGQMRLIFAYCDALYLLKTGLERAAVTTADSFRAGVESLGSSYVPTGSFVSTFSSSQHFGASSARNFAFDAGCKCFKYTGGVFSFG